MNPCDREGQFRASIEEYGLTESDKGAVGVHIRAKLHEIWDAVEKTWVAWAQYDMEAEGVSWIVKTDGTVNTNSAESLIRYANWDGNIESITDGSWQPTMIQVAIQPDEYKGKTRFRIAFVNDFNRTPGAMSTVRPDRVKALQAQFGSQLRALAGNAKRNAVPSPSKPPAPPASANPAIAGTVGNDDYPPAAGVPF